MDKRAALEYKYNDHFSLLLDDHNNDGNPDYLLRTGDPEDGKLTFRATDCKADMKICDDPVYVTVRKYNDRVWTGCGEFTAEFGPSDYCRMIHSVELEESLEKGLYQPEINTPDGIAFAGFMVRK